MALDPNYVLMIPLQDVFVDKDGSGPLSGGVVTFYQDAVAGRSVLKPVYQISGLPPYSDASYIVLPNPLILSSVGTFQDNNGNDIVPYLYPYDDNGNVQLYYITVYSSGGVFQFSREAWPNTGVANEGSVNDIINYVANGQFLLHNNQYINFATTVGADYVYQIAPGGWTFEKSTASTSTDLITFPFQNTPSIDPNQTANPKYYLRLVTTNFSGDARKDICLTFPDVNKFAGDPTNPNSEYTLSLQGYSNTGSPIMVTANLYHYFGSGVSSPAATQIGTITLNPLGASNTNIYNLTFTFGNNSGYVVGTNGDDYVKIALKFPNANNDSLISDFVLTPGDFTVTAFPQTPNDLMISQGACGYLPTPDPSGLDLYLPIVMGSTGFVYDASNIGKIYAGMYTTPGLGELLCDGTGYLVSATSPDGVPYKRLFNVLLNASTVNAPLFGGGINFVTASLNSAVNNILYISNNKAGVQTPAADSSGGTATGFTFTNCTVGTSSSGIQARVYGTTGVYFIVNVAGSPATPAVNHGGVASLAPVRSLGNSKQIFQITANAASTLTNMGGAGYYLQYSNTSDPIFIWFQVTNETQPSGSGTALKVVLLSTNSPQDVAYAMAAAVPGCESDFVACGDGASLTGGDYFTFHANSQEYVVWYTVQGVGVQPNVTNAIYIPVAVLTLDTNSEVAAKTQLAINSTYVAVPDLRGVFLRGADPNGFWDVEFQNRWSFLQFLTGAKLGTFEVDSMYSDAPGSGGSAQGYPVAEVTPVNAYVNYFIKY